MSLFTRGHTMIYQSGFDRFPCYLPPGNHHEKATRNNELPSWYLSQHDQPIQINLHYVYIYIYIHTYIYIYVHVYIYICVCSIMFED